MRITDLPAIMAIERRSYSLPWTESVFRRELEELPQSHLLVVEDAAGGDEELGLAIIGYAVWWEVVDECHIANVTVSPAARRQGVGRYLVEEMMRTAKQMGIVRATLEVRVSNEEAITLYEKCGFTSVAIRQRYYPDNNEDALVMWKERI